jgi:hypothetical protein
MECYGEWVRFVSPSQGGCAIDTQSNRGDAVAVLKEAHRRAKIHAASMIASLVVFVIAVEVIHRSSDLLERSVAGPGGFEVLRIVFYVVAIAMVFVTNVLQGLMLKGSKTSDIERLTNKLTAMNIVTSALAETPVILGFVLFVVVGYRTDFYILGFVSLYLMLRHYPYYGQWEKLAKQRMGDQWPTNPVSG